MFSARTQSSKSSRVLVRPLLMETYKASSATVSLVTSSSSSLSMSLVSFQVQTVHTSSHCTIFMARCNHRAIALMFARLSVYMSVWDKHAP